MKIENKKKIEWYNSGHAITNLIIGIILVIIICSQSFATGQGSSLELFSSIINHNSVYLFILIYFVFLKLQIGKKYFNYLNIFLVFIYFITTITSFLTMIQSFSINTSLDFIINILLFIYLIHTMFRDTRIWKEFHIGNSPFNELTNEWLFYSVLVISVFLLAVNLISTVAISGVIIAVLDTLYYILFGRYVFLYREYLDKNKLDSKAKGNFDEVRDKVQDVLDKTDIDEKIVDVKDKIVDVSKEVSKKVKEVSEDAKDKIDSFIEENEIDKKLEKASEKVKEVSEDAKDKIDSFIEENEIDKKLENVSKKVSDNTKKTVNKVKKEVSKKTTTKKAGTKKTTSKKTNTKKGDK